MPEKRLFGVHGSRIDKQAAVCVPCWDKTDWPNRTPSSPKASLSLAFLATVLLAYAGKDPALAQTSSVERQLSLATATVSDSPEMGFQGTRKSTPLLGCFSTQDAIAAILSGGQQLPAIPPEFQNPETTVTFRADSQQKIGDTYKLKGHVLINYRDMEVSADDATYDQASGEVAAVGHVTFSDPRSHLEANEGHYNFVTQ